MIIDLNPTATVGKCAGLFLCGLWRGELRERLLLGAMINFVRRRRAPPSILVRVARHFLSGFSASDDAKQIEGELHAPSTG
jgi:hypothetical protein